MPLATLTLPVRLPPGYTARPAAPADAEAAAEMSNAHNVALTGRPSITADEIKSDWGQPCMNLATNTLAIWADGGGMAGLAEIWDNDPHVRHYVFAEVHPAHRGIGIGSALAAWAETRGRELIPAAPADARVTLLQFKMSADDEAAQLLRARGYSIVRHNLRMAIEFDGALAPPVVPAGLTIRPFIPNREERAVLLATREAFRDHWGHVEKPWDDDYRQWLHFMATSPMFDPSLLFVAVDGEEVVGTALCQPDWAEDPDAGWIYSLGVRRSWRRRGVALAILQHCFLALRERGKLGAKLGVDAQSLTGATRLYEKAGMRVERQFDFHEKELRSGRDLRIEHVVWWNRE